MNALKPLFIIAVLGLATVGVYTTISRAPERGSDPPHIEGLTVPAPDAPLVQMPDSSELGSPFAMGSTPSPRPEAEIGLPHPPTAGTEPSGRDDGATTVYPSVSPYPASGAASPPPTPHAGGGGTAPRRDDSPVAAHPAPGHQGYIPPGASAAGVSGCVSGCPAGAAPFRPDVEFADSDAPAWPTSHAAVGIAPSYEPPAGEQSIEDFRRAGPTASAIERDPAMNDTRVQPGVDQAFERMMDQVSRELDAGRLAQAHSVLSRFYREPGLNPQQARQVTELLDQLAGTVIYSRQSLLEPPYTVRPGDTLQSIAQQYEVPPELIANINGIRDPRGVQPGQELKVIRGPFHAVVHLSDYELTMMLGDLYAGRFTVSVGRDQPDLEGSYIVTRKGVAPRYYGPDGATFEGDDPGNPLGSLWLGLGDRVGQNARLGIHGTNDPRNIGRDAPRGNIGLDRRDIQDIYGILSVGSRVEIRR